MKSYLNETPLTNRRQGDMQSIKEESINKKAKNKSAKKTFRNDNKKAAKRTAKKNTDKNDSLIGNNTTDGITKATDRVHSGGKEDAKKAEQKIKKPNRISVFCANHATVVIKIECPNVGKLLGAVGGICRVKVVATQKESVTVQAPSKHCGKIIDLLDKLCYTYRIIKVKGILPYAHAFLTRGGIIAGIVLSVAALAIYPCFITKVDVSGTLNAQTADILNAYGIYSGAFAPSLDCKAVENELRAADGIAFASVERRGAHVYVTLKPELAPDDYVDIAGNPVKATKRAVVTRVIVNGGTAVVKYGDVVNVGDVLIDAYTLMGEEKLPVPAGGMAYGKVYYEYSEFFSDVVSEKTYKRQKTICKLAMFGAVPDIPNSPYEEYELQTSVSDYNLMLPMKMYRYTFRELIVREYNNPYSEEQMRRIAYSKVLGKLSESAKILAEYYKTDRTQNGTVIKVTLEAEEIIC